MEPLIDVESPTGASGASAECPSRRPGEVPMTTIRLLNWLRISLVVGAACYVTALAGLNFVVVGAFTGTPETELQKDFAFGVLLGAATQLGLMLSLWTEEKGPIARTLSGLLMLPAFASFAAGNRGLLVQKGWLEAVVWSLVLAAYALQFARLGATPARLSRWLGAAWLTQMHRGTETRRGAR
jgi:hypothetical protein